MSATDFRRFIALLDEAGELVRVGEDVDWDLEVGERTRREAAGRNRAVLFERIQGYPGARILSNAIGSPSRIGIALGLPAGRSMRDVRGVVRSRLQHPIAPLVVPRDRVERETYSGDDVDLTRLPVPRWAPEDAGRYLGTWHLNLTRDPVSGSQNVGIYRMQLVDARTALVSVGGDSHLMAHVRDAEQRGEDLEMAVAIGVPEPLVLAAGSAVSPQTDELWLAGALAGSPVRVQPALTVGLEVPEDAEIIVEGHLLCGERAAEGPFVDYAGIARPNPGGLVFRASSVELREDPVFRGAAIGYPGAEDHLLYSVLSCAGCLDFRGDRTRHRLQAICLRAGWYRQFQALGRMERPFQIVGRVHDGLGRRGRAMTRRLVRRSARAT